MEKINVAELLKDCPKGMELDCTMFNNVVLYGVNGSSYPISILAGGRKKSRLNLTKTGCCNNNPDAKCVIFPKGKTTWEGFQRPFKDGDILYIYSANPWICIYKEGGEKDNVYYKHVAITSSSFVYDCAPLCHRNHVTEIRYATEEEKEKLFKKIKDNGYKWNAETKTLEELIEPKFKVGDKVQHSGATSCGSIYVIEQMKWKDNQVEYVICDLYWKNCKCTVMSKDLQPYKEETMEDIIKIDIPKGYEFVGVDKQQVVFEKIGCRYPNTYWECAKFINRFAGDKVNGYKYDLILNLQRLIICRDAYWKIAGEQMGLGKPWEPKWEIDNVKYSILVVENEIRIGDNEEIQRLLVFPTEEMRDTFLENFGHLIELCKELL